MEQFDGILGNDWLQNMRAQVDYGQRKVLTDSVSIPFLRQARVKASVCGIHIVDCDPPPTQRSVEWDSKNTECPEKPEEGDRMRRFFDMPRSVEQGSKNTRCLEDPWEGDKMRRSYDMPPSVKQGFKNVRCLEEPRKGDKMRCEHCFHNMPHNTPKGRDIVEMPDPLWTWRSNEENRRTGKSMEEVDNQATGQGKVSLKDKEKHQKKVRAKVKAFTEKVMIPSELEQNSPKYCECSEHCIKAVSTNSSNNMENCEHEAVSTCCSNPKCQCVECKNSGKRIQMLLYAKKRTVLPANTAATIRVTYAKQKHGQPTGVTMIAHSAVSPHKREHMIGNTLMNFADKMILPYINMTNNNIIVKRGEILAMAEECYPEEIIENDQVVNDALQLSGIDQQQLTCNATQLSVLDPEVLAPPTKEEDDKDRQIIDEIIKKSECPEKHISALRKMLWKYRQVLADKNDQVGFCKAYQARINLTTDKPIYTPQYPVPYRMRSAMKEIIEQFLKDGIIKNSTSPYNSPTIMVDKKDQKAGRMCVDFRNFNDFVETDRFPLPRIDQILEELGGASFLTALDLLHGFYNLEIHPADRHKTAFSTPDGHYEFIRLPMGMKNSPSIFQRAMNMVLQEMIGKYCFIYVDDIVIYSKTADDHLKHLDLVFSKLAKNGLKIKASKAQIFQTRIHYLGFIVSNDGL